MSAKKAAPPVKPAASDKPALVLTALDFLAGLLPSGVSAVDREEIAMMREALVRYADVQPWLARTLTSIREGVSGSWSVERALLTIALQAAERAGAAALDGTRLDTLEGYADLVTLTTVEDLDDEESMWVVRGINGDQFAGATLRQAIDGATSALRPGSDGEAQTLAGLAVDDALSLARDEAPGNQGADHAGG